jgi:hypothetical protein
MVSQITEQYKHRDAHPSTYKKKTKKGKEGWSLFSKIFCGGGSAMAYIRLAAKWWPCNESCGGWSAERLSQQLPARSLSLRWRARHQALLVGWRHGAGDVQGRNFRTLRCGCWFSGVFLFGSIAFLEGESSWGDSTGRFPRSHGAGVTSTATAALTNVSSQLCAAQ